VAHATSTTVIGPEPHIVHVDVRAERGLGSAELKRKIGASFHLAIATARLVALGTAPRL
jgi:hypothetical protein